MTKWLKGDFSVKTRIEALSARPVALRLRAIAIVALCAAGAYGCLPSFGPELFGLSEASANFDLAQVKPFLARIATQVEGLNASEIDRISDEIADMPVESEQSWELEVMHQGEATPLHLRVFMDDVEAPDVYFYTTPELAATIDEEMGRFFGF